MTSAIVIILVGSLVASSCALVGSFLVLRRMALLGDAISHAVLLGIVAAFFLTGSRHPLPMVLGAGAVGLLTVFLVETLARTRRMAEDASIGVVFPALFSLGVILVSRYADQVHLDLDCVLYGEIGFAPLYALTLGGVDLGPKALWVTGVIFCLDLALVILLYKELKLSSFDPDLAGSLGFSPVFLHYVLMAAVSVTVVGSFESVGAILVVAMLVVPPASAYLLTDRLGVMLVLAVLLGIASTAGGYAFARWLDCSIAGSMAAVAGLFFVGATLASPRHGLVARSLGSRRLALRLRAQLLLLHLKGRTDASPGKPLGERDIEDRFGWRRAQAMRVVHWLVREGLVEVVDGGLKLTPLGAQSLEKAGTAYLAHPC